MNDDAKMVCERCGSEDVLADAWAVWSPARQDWELRDVFEYGHCKRCNGENRIVPCSRPPTASPFACPGSSPEGRPVAEAGARRTRFGVVS